MALLFLRQRQKRAVKDDVPRQNIVKGRVYSVNSNLTGLPVFFCRTVARSTAYPLGAMPRRELRRHRSPAACCRREIEHC